ncbi:MULTISPECIES: hypothetical protein [Vreelandella]|uniref:DUF2946 domain-containing protein n=2 Tax=Vreelandella TaxID=3137766 RepID=A0A7C9K495_9GAMM|nr:MULTISPECIES: hypothetical protein [Halomonas]NDL69141.1 hypothetical protein [Halomonas alkaliphila]NYS44162.1 hypothetical protein [Halomonas zhaodongensis]
MTGSAFKWLLCVLLGFALAQPITVMAIDYHENTPCLVTGVDQASGAAELNGVVSGGDHDTSHAPECGMPCAQCAANLAMPIEDVTSAMPALPCYLVNWLPAHRAPLERPPRV